MASLVRVLRIAVLIAAPLLPVVGAGCEPPQAPRPPLGYPVFADFRELSQNENTWPNIRPLALLAVLRLHPGRTLRLFASPPGWITAGDLAGLRELADSDAPAAVTCPFMAAHAPPANASSTIGREARSMIRAAERGSTWPPATCSDLIGDLRRRTPIP